MNQQLIEQLAEQANFKKDTFVVGYWDMPECQKFVALVVQECCNQLREIDAMAIRKHFGVTE
jgi:hypothetical protein